MICRPLASPTATSRRWRPALQASRRRHIPEHGVAGQAFKSYADYALTPPFREALETLIGEAGACASAVMCAEAVWWQCHRRIITDYLIAAGIDVRHIMSAGQINPAELGEDAVIQPGGTVHYPAAQAELF